MDNVILKSDDGRSAQVTYFNGTREKILGHISKNGDIKENAIKLIKNLPFDFEMIARYEKAKEEIVKILNGYME